MQVAWLRISQSQSTVELAPGSAMGLAVVTTPSRRKTACGGSPSATPRAGPTTPPCRWDKTALVYAEYRWRRGAAGISISGGRSRTGRRRRYWRRKTPGWRETGAGDGLTSPAAWRSSISPGMGRRSRKSSRCRRAGGHCPILGVGPTSTGPGAALGKVWMWPTPSQNSSPLASRSPVLAPRDADPVS